MTWSANAILCFASMRSRTPYSRRAASRAVARSAASGSPSAISGTASRASACGRRRPMYA